MLKAIKDKIFQHDTHQDELIKLQQISEKAEQFEQSVIESMNAAFHESESKTLEDDLDSESMF